MKKMLIFNTCRRGLMPNLIKKSWMVSSPDVVCISAPECRKFWWGGHNPVPWLEQGQYIFQNLEGMKPFPSFTFLELFRSLMYFFVIILSHCSLLLSWRILQSTHPHMFRWSFRYKDHDRPTNLLEHIQKGTRLPSFFDREHLARDP